MAKFLRYINEANIPEFVRVSDISACVQCPTQGQQPHTEIWLRSDPESSLRAKGYPEEVMSGEILSITSDY